MEQGGILSFGTTDAWNSNGKVAERSTIEINEFEMVDSYFELFYCTLKFVVFNNLKRPQYARVTKAQLFMSMHLSYVWPRLSTSACFTALSIFLQY